MSVTTVPAAKPIAWEVQVVPQLTWVAAVGLDRIAVHDEPREAPSLAFALSRLSWGPVMPTPIGIFRDVERAVYEQEVDRQLVAAQSGGPADLDALLGSGTTWDVG